jgi:hypothetical protein
MALRERTFTVDEHHRMVQAGILGEDERVELIVGRIIQLEDDRQMGAPVYARAVSPSFDRGPRRQANLWTTRVADPR